MWREREEEWRERRQEGKKTGRERKIESQDSIMEKLSRDLMIDILSRLPIKYVLRCKSVSKSWEALLSDPSFAAIHFSRASTLTPFSDYIVSYEKHSYFIETEKEDNQTSTISKLKHLTFPFLTGYLIGSCLGYLCSSAIGGALTNPMYLFNPITGAKILLPQFEENLSNSCVGGFGLDVSKQECKVVLAFLHEKTFQCKSTLGRDYSWRTNTVPSMLIDVTRADLQTSLPLEFKRSIHWIVLSSVDKDDSFGARWTKDDEFRTCILSFQLDTEVFGVIPMPEPLQLRKPYFHYSMAYALQVSGGCLSIIYSPEASFVDMWVMADYNISQSWVKKYSIQLNCMGRSEIRPIGFHKNGELMLHLSNKGLTSYNTDSDKYKILCYCPYLAFPFVGSLISLKSAYGDSKVVGTSGFGNPIQKQ